MSAPSSEQLAEAVERVRGEIQAAGDHYIPERNYVLVNVVDLETLLSALQAQDAALRQCRDQFAFYAHEHLAAGKETKALTNQRFSDIAATALGDPTP